MVTVTVLVPVRVTLSVDLENIFQGLLSSVRFIFTGFVLDSTNFPVHFSGNKSRIFCSDPSGTVVSSAILVTQLARCGATHAFAQAIADL